MQVKTIVQDVSNKLTRESADGVLNDELAIGWDILNLTVFPPVHRDGMREIQRMVTLIWRSPKMMWEE